MKRFATMLSLLFVLSASAHAAAPGPAVVLDIRGVIGHAVLNYIARGIKHAEETGASCVIIRIDTPGGLMESMKEVAGAMLNTRLPVVVYVAPRGATATSAGFFLLMASDYAVMAGGTSTGSAHPVNTGGTMDKTMSEKVTNYAVSYMETLASRRGRNVKWAENAVRKSVSITAEKAVAKRVADFTADSIPELLRKLDGRKLTKNKIHITLRTKGAREERVAMSPREKILQLIGHPNIAYILFMIGVYGLIFEVTHPGVIVPGAVGAVCLILAFTAFQVIPINSIGLVLILAAVALFLVEIKLTTHGLGAIGGIALMLLGSLMLVDSPDPGGRVSLGLILGVTATSAFFFLVALAAILRTYKGRVTTGVQGLIGMTGVVRRELAPEGTIMVNGELWHARLRDGGTLPEGRRIEVLSVENMTIDVKPADS